MLTLLAKTQAPKENPTEWVLVPAGEFTMGAEGAPATADEGPKQVRNTACIWTPITSANTRSQTTVPYVCQSHGSQTP